MRDDERMPGAYGKAISDNHTVLIAVNNSIWLERAERASAGFFFVLHCSIEKRPDLLEIWPDARLSSFMFLNLLRLKAMLNFQHTF